VGVDHPWNPAAGLNDIREAVGRIGVVGVNLARLVGQHRLQHDAVVDVGGRDLNRSHQPAGLIHRNMRLVAVEVAGRFGFRGKPGSVRSSAWIGDFSSTESATAWAGGST
jgi:hypothetical protein